MLYSYLCVNTHESSMWTPMHGLSPSASGRVWAALYTNRTAWLLKALWLMDAIRIASRSHFSHPSMRRIVSSPCKTCSIAGGGFGMSSGRERFTTWRDQKFSGGDEHAGVYCQAHCSRTVRAIRHGRLAIARFFGHVHWSGFGAQVFKPSHSRCTSI